MESTLPLCITPMIRLRPVGLVCVLVWMRMAMMLVKIAQLRIFCRCLFYVCWLSYNNLNTFEWMLNRWASQNKHMGVVEYLKEAQADVNDEIEVISSCLTSYGKSDYSGVTTVVRLVGPRRGKHCGLT